MKKARLRLSLQQLVLMAIILTIGEGLRVANLGNVASRTPDERIYTQQANVWRQSGQPGIRALVETYRRDSVARLYPMPTRAGMIRLVAMMMSLTGRNDEAVGAVLSCAASIGSLYILALIGIRFFPVWAAVAGLIFYSVFPAALAIARRTWADALVELSSLLLLWLACEITRNPGRRLWYLLFAGVGSASIAVKESMPVPYGLLGLWVLWVVIKARKEWKTGAIFILASIVGLTASLFWLARMTGSFSDLIAIITGIQNVNATNAYAIEYASGPGYLLLQAFWILSPITTVVAVAGLYVALRRPPELVGDSQPIVCLGVFSIANLLIAMVIPHWLNLRYVSMTFGPICLLAGLGAWYLFSVCSRRLVQEKRKVLTVGMVAILIVTALTDYWRFQRIFVQDETADLTIKMLRDERAR